MKTDIISHNQSAGLSNAVILDSAYLNENKDIAAALDFCSLNLQLSLNAKQTLREVGISDEKAIPKFRLGMINQSLQWLDNLIVDIPKNTLLFPLYDIDGNVIGFYGYRIDPVPIYEQARITLFGSNNVGVFNLSAINEHTEITVCSDPIQACQLWCQGYRNIVSVMSDTEITYAQVQPLFKNSPVVKAVFIESRDLIAQHQSSQLMLYLKSMGIECISQEG